MTETWQDHWNEQAEAEKGSLDAMSVAALLAQVRAGRFGGYYNIWYSIAARVPLADYAGLFVAVLHSDIDYLYRYHCAQALLNALDDTGLAAVDLSGDHPGRPERLARFESLLRVRGLIPSV